MRVRPVHISFLKEARNALSYRHCSFHIINRPQAGRVLKYFMRLVPIGFAYGGDRSRVSDPAKFRCRSAARQARPYSASIVPRQFEAPQWQANFLFDSSVIGSSISIA